MRCGFLCWRLGMTFYDSFNNLKKALISLITDISKASVHLLDRFVGSVAMVAIDFADWFNDLFRR